MLLAFSVRRITSLWCLIALGVFSQPTVFAQKADWSQSPEIQDAIARGTTTAAAQKPNATVSNAVFNKGPKPEWIWGEDNDKNYVLQTTFKISAVRAARLMASSDNFGSVFVNGKRVADSQEWSEPMVASVTEHLVDGENTIEAEVGNQGGVAAFVLKLAIELKDGSVKYVATNTKTWHVVKKRGQQEPGTAVASRGMLGDSPWNNVFNNETSYSGRVPRNVFEVLPGFQVEKLFSVPRDQLGSWVCLTTDHKGRLLVSDQGGKGLCRIIPGKIGTAEPTQVERLDFSACEFQPTGAQGMLYAFNSLYICCNGGPGSGLYRARDTNGDDQFDECVRLKAFRGGGEHGPHSLRLSPDGKRIFVIAGNHTDPPFKAGEDLENENYTSRIPTNWDEDLLLPRMWDANGHARGKLAPGGWIASTDPDGKTWDLFSIGYRNPYDMAFNADGELFAYDADMEWDVGSPWYRPTRVVHATSGSEFGWRSGTGKWPAYYLDSLPPLVNIGPGSPVGVDFGYGLKFPEKYQRALFICDWTFGTMYAIHLKPERSSYVATKEEFVSRSPLPLTDVVAGKDGAMYFTIGGRGTQSELYRVTYVGEESTRLANYKLDQVSSKRALRGEFEKIHGRNFEKSPVAELKGRTTPRMLEDDRFLRYAERMAWTQPSLRAELLDRLSDMQEPSFIKTVDTLTAVARARHATNAKTQEMASAAFSRLLKFEFSALKPSEKLDYLRTFSLITTRLAAPGKQQRQAFLQKLDNAFPTKDNAINRELSQTLVYLQSPTIVAKVTALLSQPPQRQDIDMADLLARNPGYGRAINAMINNQPDQQQVWYAFVLRNLKTSWAKSERQAYFAWFGRAQKWAGGNSFRKFLMNIENEAFLNAPENDRVIIEASGLRQPFQLAKIPDIAGPGKDWTLDEVRELARNELKQRDFANGKKMFSATRCILCHRFNNEGGATGPDLTQLANRFNLKDLTEAIMEPSKVISDQYKGSIVVLESGKVLVGRVVSENDKQISLLTNPEDSTKVNDILRADIDEIQPAKVSIMPKDLLKPLNKNEILDLLAYLLSRGDKNHPLFRK